MSASTEADQYTYIGTPPTVTGISPAVGPTAGGTWVLITGTNLNDATRVTFGGVWAPYLQIFSPTRVLTQTLPTNEGTFDVQVSNPYGISSLTSADLFTFIAAPAVTGLSPDSGPTTGDTHVTISGTDFFAPLSVSFGGASTISATMVSPTEIDVTTPHHWPGVVSVIVTTPYGTSEDSDANQFTYVGTPPAVTSVSPSQGPTDGGNAVFIYGTGFNNTTTVYFGSYPAQILAAYGNDEIVARVPAQWAGTVDVRVIDYFNGPSGITAADHYTYLPPPPPIVTGINPISGPTTGGTSVTIIGSRFAGADYVSFGSEIASFFTVDSDTQITVTAPPNFPGTVDVTVFKDGATSSTSAADQFTYFPVPPVVGGINPNYGPTSGGTSVIITGSGFLGASDVEFGSTAAAWFQVDSDTQIEAISPAEPAGTVDVTVTTTGGTSAIVPADQFTFVEGGHGGGFSSRGRYIKKTPAGRRPQGHHPRHLRPHPSTPHPAHRPKPVSRTDELRVLDAFFASFFAIA
jgi:hypothetical protein